VIPLLFTRVDDAIATLRRLRRGEPAAPREAAA
jgi:hypothetical protein